MPKAVANIQETHRLDLKSLPGGFVLVRKLTYGEKQRRMQLAAGQSMDTGANRQNGQGRVDVAIHYFDLQFYDFSKCIVDHNLTKDDDDKIPMNFRNMADFEMLDDAIGIEIEEFIDKINNVETEEDKESFQEVTTQRDSEGPADNGEPREAAKDTGSK